MSYILDALSKSERERAKQQIPGLETIQRLPASKKRPWMFVLVILILINTAFLIAWLILGRQDDLARANAPRPIIEATTESPPTPPANTPMSVAAAPVAPVNLTPVPVSSLPREVRDGIPALTFSSHIYALEPTFRVVNINGSRLREGEMVTPQIKLIAITEEGVVLEHGGYRIALSVLEDWSAP